MRIDDTILGAVLLAFAVAIVAYAQTFPTLGGMAFGPDLFPTVIGFGLGICGLGLMASGIARRRAKGGLPWVDIAPWMRSRDLGGNLLAVLAATLAYILLSDWLGFHLTAMAILVLLFLKLHVRLVILVPFAIVVPLVIHYAFYSLLRVPLPWGVLTPIAW